MMVWHVRMVPPNHSENRRALLDEMSGAGIEPDEIAYCAFFNACAYRPDGSWPMARAALAEMKQAGVRPGSYTYKPLLQVLSRTSSRGDESARQVMLSLVFEAIDAGLFNDHARQVALRAPSLTVEDKAKFPSAQQPARRAGNAGFRRRAGEVGRKS